MVERIERRGVKFDVVGHVVEPGTLLLSPDGQLYIFRGLAGDRVNYSIPGVMTTFSLYRPASDVLRSRRVVRADRS